MAAQERHISRRGVKHPQPKKGLHPRSAEIGGCHIGYYEIGMGAVYVSSTSSWNIKRAVMRIILTRKIRPSLESGIKALTSFSIGPLGDANIRNSCHFLILYISAWPVDRWPSHRRNSSRFASSGVSALSTALAWSQAASVALVSITASEVEFSTEDNAHRIVLGFL